MLKMFFYSLLIVSSMFQAGGDVASTSCPERAVCEASWAIESERMVRGSPGGSPSWMMGMVRRGHLKALQKDHQKSPQEVHQGEASEEIR